MKSKKNLKKILLALLAVSIIAAIGATAAYMFKTSDKAQNNFVPAKVTCKVEEVFDEAAGIKKSVKAQNTGNIDAYLRVRLVSYWVDDNGDIVGKPSEIPTPEYNTAAWDYDEKNFTYYCKTPIAPNGLTPELLANDAQIVLQTSTLDDKPVYQVVEVIAEAIQANPKTAAEEAWGRVFQ